MFLDIVLAIVQAATEFLPVSSSGHLALISNIASTPDLFFFTVLHAASLVAVLIFTRREITELFQLKKESLFLWLYVVIATIPAAVFGFLFNETIEETFSSNIFIGISYIFTGFILLATRFFQKNSSNLNIKNSIIIGIVQVLALFPGVSRSGVTISTALFMGIDREKAARFSFLLFIPLSVGALILEAGKKAYFNTSLFISFVVCLLLSLVFLKLLLWLVKRGAFWVFSVYCFLIGTLTLLLSR